MAAKSWKAVVNRGGLSGFSEVRTMAKSSTKTDRVLMVVGVAGLAASRIIPVPTPILITFGIILSVTIIWLGGRALIHRRREKREDRQTAWKTFVRDRDVQ